ncbi:MAG: DUF483 domain-containing protein [Candidatus Nealsonbacteria bacterium]|nr:MAG: DUF483 domain-containing protein [Candidatus Nealsonbacteria bacterium]
MRRISNVSEFEDYPFTPFNAVEFISLKYNLRKVVQLDLRSERRFLDLQKIVKKLGWAVVKSNFKFDLEERKKGNFKRIDINDKRKGEFRIYIFNPKRFKIPHESEKLGRLMGYPSCCIDSYMECMKANKDIFGCMNITKDSSFPFLINPFARLVSNAYLINHFPCSLNCKKSLKLAKAISKVIQSNYPHFYKKIYQYCHFPVLVFPNSSANYDMREEIPLLLLMEKSKEEQSYKILSNALRNNLYKNFENADTIVVSRENIKVFRNNILKSQIDRSAVEFYFLVPY